MIFIILYLVLFLFYMNYLYTQNKFEWDRADNNVVRRVWENHVATSNIKNNIYFCFIILCFKF